jgi:hypothetical protein
MDRELDDVQEASSPMTDNRSPSVPVIGSEIDAYRAALKTAVMTYAVDLAVRAATGLSFRFRAIGTRSARPQYLPVVVERRL